MAIAGKYINIRELALMPRYISGTQKNPYLNHINEMRKVNMAKGISFFVWVKNDISRRSNIHRCKKITPLLALSV